MQQIERLLRDGKSSRQVIDTGYKSSSVYKAQRRLRAGVGGARSGAIAQRGNRADETVAANNDPVGLMAGRGDAQQDPEVESHPDIIELKRELRKAQLQGQIAAVRVPDGVETRLDSLEKTVDEMADLVVWLVTPDENPEGDEFVTGETLYLSPHGTPSR